MRPDAWRALSWLAALAPAVLLAAFLITALFYSDAEAVEMGDAVSTPVNFVVSCLRWWFLFTFYLAAPLWSAVMVHPPLRPTPTHIGVQIAMFGGGWFAWFCCVQIDLELARSILPLL